MSASTELTSVDVLLAAAPAPQAMQREPPKPICATEAEAKAWAAEWWRGYTVKAHDGALYTEPEGLYALMEAQEGGVPAPVKPLRLSWMLRRADKLRRATTDEERRALAMPRRQELERSEPEAFLTPAEARALGRGHVGTDLENCGCEGDGGFCCKPMTKETKARRPLKLLSMSHGWLTPEHPDPLGQQLVRFADQVQHERRYLKGDSGEQCLNVCCFGLLCGMSGGCCCCVVPLYGQQCGRCFHQLPSGEFGVFYDYGSLLQKDAAGERTAAEKAAFGKALETMGAWYAHGLTTTFISSELPPGWPRRPEDAPFFPEGWLRGKGWPTFERAVSNMIKPSANSWRRVVDPQAKVQFIGALREPPLPPEEFAARLARAIFTNGKADCELVAGLYADTLAGAFGHATTLEYKFAAWGDAEATAMAKVLPLATRATYLNLAGNSGIGREGLDALAEALRGGAAPMLERIKFHNWVNAGLILGGGWGSKADGLRAACDERKIAIIEEALFTQRRRAARWEVALVGGPIF